MIWVGKSKIVALGQKTTLHKRIDANAWSTVCKSAVLFVRNLFTAFFTTGKETNLSSQGSHRVAFRCLCH